MQILLDVVVLIVGFALLIKGADWFVDGSASVAKKLRVPTLIIGMTIVAMGTSAPECAVSIAASLKGSNSMAISNVIGSNFFNLLVVCGVCALFKTLPIKKSTLKMEFPFSILAGILLVVLGYFGMSIGHLDGAILLVIFVAFLIWMVLSAKKARDAAEDEEIKTMPGWKCAVYILVGIAAIVVGGDFVVDSASDIAALFGLSQTLIGLTIVAFGTSLPELVTSIVAARKGEVDMALGNVIGSNLFNVLFVLGIAAAVSPMTMLAENVIDGILLAVVSIITLLFAIKSQNINRKEGAAMLVMYGAYIVYACVR